MSSKWSLFGISFGCVIILLSQMVEKPLLSIVSGLVITLYSTYRLLRQKKQAR